MAATDLCSTAAGAGIVNTHTCTELTVHPLRHNSMTTGGLNCSRRYGSRQHKVVGATILLLENGVLKTKIQMYGGW